MIIIIFFAIFLTSFIHGMHNNNEMTFQFFSEESDTSDNSEENDIIRKKLQKYLKNTRYNKLKLCLMQQDFQDYIAKNSTLLFWAIKKTDNPLMIKLLIDHGINLDYWNENTNETIFHVISAHERLINDDIILALISRFITTKDFFEIEGLSHLLKKINFDDKKTAFKQALYEEKIFLNARGRPYFYIDPLVEIILKEKDPEYLINYIIPIINYHNTIVSNQKFNVLKNNPPKKNYIHDYNKPISPTIRPSIAIQLLSHDLWNKFFLNKKINKKLFKKIIKYRNDNNYDQFKLPQILTGVMEYKRLSEKNSDSLRIQSSTSLASKIRYPKRKLTPMIESLHIKNTIDRNTN